MTINLSLEPSMRGEDVMKRYEIDIELPFEVDRDKPKK